jgi:CRISPR system Cascade subunit CasA
VTVAYNLVDERWIPVERQSGSVEYVSLAEIADRTDPALRIASPPPDAAAVKSKLQHFKDAFFLDGDGPRFMQDLSVERDPKKITEPIGALLIDRIGEDGLGEAPSLFAKPGGFETLGYPAAAAALMAIQSYAPAGGAGVMTSLRGGGPLTTLVVGDDLWRTVWLNVLPREVIDELPGGADEDDAGAVFPWMARTRDGSKPTLPKHIHQLQHLWGLPRRVRLAFEDALGTCAVSGESGVPVVRAYVSRPKGTNYKGAFLHPFTPYSEVKPGEPWNPKKASADGLPYRDWPLLVTGTKTRRPAAVVSHFIASRRHLVKQPRVLAFGYAMNKMKPVRWSRAETPLVAVDPKNAESFAAVVERLVGASEEVRGTLSAKLREAWSDRPRSIEVAGKLNPAFWSSTEPGFFRAVHDAKTALETGDVAALDAVREAWLATLHDAAVRLFDVFVDAAASLAPPELGRMVAARRELILFTSPTARKLRNLVELPVEDVAVAGRRKRGKGRQDEGGRT